MIHPGTTLNGVSDSIGVGVFARTFIPKGTLIYVQDKLEISISPDDFEGLDEPLKSMTEKFSFIDPRGHRILSWDTAKYVNHSCDPNTMSSGYGFEVALRDIQPGEEITDEYGLFNLQHDIECLCGSVHCRKVIRSTDIDKFHVAWDDRVTDALLHVREVEQPLLDLLDKNHRAALEDYLDTGLGYRSVRDLKYDPFAEDLVDVEWVGSLNGHGTDSIRTFTSDRRT